MKTENKFDWGKVNTKKELLLLIRNWLIYTPHNFAPPRSYAGAMLRKTCKDEVVEVIKTINRVLG